MMLHGAQQTMTRTVPQFTLFLLALTAFFINPRSVQAFGGVRNALPDFPDSYHSTQNGNGDILSGVYVSDVLELPVIQQPADSPYYVSNRNGEATQFSMASEYGNIGLLAHNTLSGKYFSKLAVGQQVRLMYGDGRVEYFVVEQVLHFQALQPESVSSSFKNLDKSEVLSSGEMFNRVYVGEHRLIFQTCIQAQGNVSWGRLFVIAVPKN